MSRLPRFVLPLVVGIGVGALIAACSHHPQAAGVSAFRTVAGSFLEAPAFAQASARPGAPTLADIAERSVSGVVNISSTNVTHGESAPMTPLLNDPFFRRFLEGPFGFNGAPRERREQSLGSGVVVSVDGLVLTNNHVVDNAEKIKVTLHDHSEYTAKVIGKDPKSDLALLRLQGRPRGLKPLPLGDSDRLRLGDVVLAIGNPFGVGQTVTMGIVSAKGRANVGITDYEDFIQTDAAINPGNSGGALVDLRGALIGINTAILSRTGGYQGIGFAIPSNMVKPIMESLLTHGKVTRGWLGVAIQDLTPDLARAMNLRSTGVLVSDVTPSSPAARAGVQRGDVVLRVDSQTVASSAQLRNVIASRGPRATVTLALLRRGAPRTLRVALGELPSAQAAAPVAEERAEERGMLGGITVASLNEAARQRYKIPREVRPGVVVEAIDPSSAAASSGLQRGDVILEVNRTPVDSRSTFNERYRAAHGKVLLLIYHDGSTIYVLIEH
jgi:serine protease Do